VIASTLSFLVASPRPVLRFAASLARRAFRPTGFALALLVSLSPALALAQNCPTRASWPTTEWPQNLVSATAKATQLKALEDFAFTLVGKDSERLGYRTEGLVIIKNGAIVYERYARGFDATRRHLSWSVAKSFSSALVGIAVHQQDLELDDSICQHLPEFEGTPQCAITVKDAITFGTALGWQEEYEDQSYQVSSVISMLFGSGHKDQLKHILTHKLVGTPGKRWSYSTGDAELASAVAKRAMIRAHGKDSFWKLLFDPIGMPRTTFEDDAKGTPLGGSMVWATPRDFAKFGFLFLNDGCWDGTRILPEGWVAASTTPSEVFVATAPDNEKTPSGYSWWLNRPVPSQNKPLPWPDAPDDTYAALGHWGQRIIVVPSEDVIIVRVGDDRDGSIDVNELTKHALAVTR
jgi:CubicO group peptidase (beta-lactamase class C family)